MFRSLKFLFLLFAFLASNMLFAQAGKLVGKVIDLETGEALIGANVLLEGTSMGAATDENGDYIMLNVTPGTYTVKARFIGYREQITSNIRVSVNLTTEANFALPTEEYQTETIVVSAPKPLVDKNITNSTSVVKAEDIENLPVRGVNAIVATQAGVVSGRGGLNIRGSRSDATAYYVDGVLVTDPIFGGSSSGVINNAVEEIQVQAGGYSAEFGGANGGIIATTTRVGGEKYDIGIEAISDAFVKTGEDYLGGYSYGYTELVLTAGGPLIPGYNKIRFFLAGSNIFQRTGANFYEGYDFQGIFDPSLGESADTINLFYPGGQNVNSQNNNWQLQGNLTWDLNPFTIRINSNFRRTDGRNGTATFTFVDALEASSRAGLHEDHTWSSSLKLTHVLSANSFYDLIVNYVDDFSVDMDPFFKHDITMYGDSIANAEIGRQMQADGDNLNPLNMYGQSLAPGPTPYNNYTKQKFQSIGGKVNFLYQLGKHHEFKTGGEFTRYTARYYSLGPRTIASLAKSIADGDVYKIYNRVDNYGYDVYGNAVDVEGDIEAPRNPVFAAYYIQDKMEFTDLVLNVGFRLDYIDVDDQTFEDPSRVQFLPNGQIDPSILKDIDPTLQVSPRIGISFPVTDRTVFHAQYGKFIQQSRLRDSYQGYNLIADNIRGGFAISSPVGFGIRPERTTSYEIGFRQQIGEVFAFDITGFYKDIKDQVQIRPIFAASDANHRQYYSWQNGDFATTKGVELKLDLRRVQRLSAQVDYTYSDALGTGSNPSTAFRTIWVSPTNDPFYPQQIAPLDFNQTHRGFINVDYRFGSEDGPEVLGSQILSNLGLNLLFSFNSGFNFTRWDGFGNSRTPNEALNSSTTPWNFQLDLRLDKSFEFGPLDFNVYAWVINVLDIKNITNVYNISGDAIDDGWLASNEGSATTEGYRRYGDEYAQTYTDLYRAASYGTGGNFGVPRQIRFGIRLNY